jgi:hypothetical protein
MIPIEALWDSIGDGSELYLSSSTISRTCRRCPTLPNWVRSKVRWSFTAIRINWKSSEEK